MGKEISDLPQMTVRVWPSFKQEFVNAAAEALECPPENLNKRMTDEHRAALLMFMGSDIETRLHWINQAMMRAKREHLSAAATWAAQVADEAADEGEREKPKRKRRSR